MQIHRVLLVTILSTLTLNCTIESDPYLLTCQTILEESLVSPSSLKIVRSQTNEIVAEVVTVIEYDAANSYSTLLRGNIECRYHRPTPKSDSDPGTISDRYEAARAANELIMRIAQDGEVIAEECLDESDSDIDCAEKSLRLLVMKTRTFTRLLQLGRR